MNNSVSSTSAKSLFDAIPAHYDVQRLRRSTQRWLLVGFTLLIASFLWAIWYRQQGAVEQSASSQSETKLVSDGRPGMVNPAEVALPITTNALTESAFAVALWRELPKPKADVLPQSKVPVLRLQLLAISFSAGHSPNAVLYDEEFDSVTKLRSGTTYRGYRVAVDSNRVVLEPVDGSSQVVTLVLNASNTQMRETSP